MSQTLVGPPRDNPELDHLAVQLTPQQPTKSIADGIKKCIPLFNGTQEDDRRGVKISVTSF